MQKPFYWLSAILLFTSLPCTAANTIEASYYWDKRQFNTLSLQISSNELGQGFSMWGFTDFHSQRYKAGSRYDFTQSFSEYRLSNNLLGAQLGDKGLELQLEVNDSIPGAGNTNLRSGLTYMSRLGPLWYQARVFPWQLKQQGQLSLAFKLTLHQRFTVTGFIDGNLLDDNSWRWVAEPQLNVQLGANSWLIAEYRYNEFEGKQSALDEEAWAAGFRYEF